MEDDRRRRAICIQVWIGDRWRWLEDRRWTLDALRAEVEVPDGFELWTRSDGSQYPLARREPTDTFGLSPGCELYIVDRRKPDWPPSPSPRPVLSQ